MIIMPGWRLPAGRQGMADARCLIIKKMNYYVYVLKSVKKKYLYVGLTKNVKIRFLQHQKGFEKTTRPYRPFKLILTEKFDSRLDARNREKYLKSGCGKEYIKNLFS
jgi:putative endonuclease